MKLAFPSDDGETISAHFGRAAFFVVVGIGEDAAIAPEKRAKPAHGGHGHGHDHGHDHDHGPEPITLMERPAPVSHGGMLEPVADCQVLIAGGMGQPAYEQARAAGLEVVLTGERDIAKAAAAYAAGTLASDPRRVHQH